MRRFIAAPLLGLLAVTAALSGCTAQPALEVTTAPPAAEIAEVTPSAAPVQERGTRSNPLAIGESRKISAKSMWTVGAAGPTVAQNGFVSVPLTISMDWEASRAQAVEAGSDPTGIDEAGVDPSFALFFTFVAANGTSYNTLTTVPDDVPMPQIWQVGTVFPPAESVSTNVAVSVPADAVAGGVWQIRNQNGDTLYVSQ